MPISGMFLFATWLLAAAVSYCLVRDIFSPDKLLLAALGLFFGDIFFHDYSLEICFVFLLLIITVVTVIVALAPILRRARPKSKAASANATQLPRTPSLDSYKFFWFASLPALVAQVGLIEHFGGIQGYVNVLAFREVSFQGLGWLISIIRTFSIVNLVYFSFLISRSRRRWRDIALYGAHLTVFVFMALLTGSRGSLLGNFALMALVYHHSVRRISARWLFMFVFSIFIVASVLEVAREGVSFGEEGLVTGLSKARHNERKMTFRWAEYGLMPLDLVLNANHINKQFGLTYLTVFTNLVPRGIWPTKPDPGGNVLTNDYASDEWGGYSYLSTGIVPEAIINFGHPIGILFGTLQFGALVGWLLLLYQKYKQRLVTNDSYNFIHSVRFAYISFGIMGLIVGEFTNIIFLLLIQLSTVWILYTFLKLSTNVIFFKVKPVHRKELITATRPI